MGQSSEAAMLPIAPGLFVDEDLRPDRVRLLGGRHVADGRVVFPFPEGAEDDDVVPHPLSRDGRLWSFTVQRFRPKSPPYDGPEAFTPFALGYVELGGEVIVESRLTGIAFDDLRIGMPLRLVTEPLPLSDGSTRLGFAFTAVEE